MTTAQPLLAPTDSPTVHLLGPLGVAGCPAPTAKMQRQVLAVLAIHAGHLTPMAKFVQELWGGPTRCSRGSVETYVLFLRRLIGRDSIVFSRGGYTLAIPPLQVDAHRFDSYVSQAEHEYRLRGFGACGDLLRAALSLWVGDPLADVEQGPVSTQFARRMIDRHHTARLLTVDVALATSRHRDVLDPLRAMVREDWCAEDVARRLMVALYRSQRRVEALNVYRTVREALADEQGLDPCDDLNRLHHQILAGDPQLNGE